MTTDHGLARTEELRRSNAALVLRLLRDEGPASRSDLALRTGLAKATVGAIVARLQEEGAVDEAAPTPAAGRGRPSVPVRLHGRSLAGLGIEVNVDYTAVTVLDLAGREIGFEETRHAHPPRPGDVADLAADHLARLHAAGTRVLGLTVAVPGLVDRERGRVVRAPNLAWRDVDLAGLLRATTGGDLEVAVDNDANCAVRAESLRGAAVGVRDLVYLTGTVGLGAGIVSRGRVVRGSRGLAGEVGHLRVGSGARCGCGRLGCWEAVAGQRALVAATGVEVGPTEDPVAYAERLAGDDVARERLRPVVEAMCRGVSLLALTLDPEVVVLGGAFVPLGSLLAPALERHLAADVTAEATGTGPRVTLSTLGLHAASMGAALDAVDDVYLGRRPLPAPSAPGVGASEVRLP